MGTHRNVVCEARKTLFRPSRESRAFSNAAEKHTRNATATAADLRLTDSRRPTGQFLLRAIGRAQRAMCSE